MDEIRGKHHQLPTLRVLTRKIERSSGGYVSQIMSTSFRLGSDSQ